MNFLQANRYRRYTRGIPKTERHQTCRRRLCSCEQATFISGGSWQQETLFTLLLQQMFHVGNATTDATSRDRLEVPAVAQHVKTQLLLCITLVISSGYKLFKTNNFIEHQKALVVFKYTHKCSIVCSVKKKQNGSD